jgi:hypothetical protein
LRLWAYDHETSNLICEMELQRHGNLSGAEKAEARAFLREMGVK